MFGLAMSSPRPPEPPVDFDAPPPPTAICMDCDTTVVLIAGRLPLGWEEVERRWGTLARCSACRQSREAKSSAAPKRTVKAAAPRPLAAAATDAPPLGSIYAGARVHHWLVGGNAVLRIHGGAAPRPSGRDEPVHFLATPADLDDLIIRLDGIRASLRTKDASQ